MDEPLPTTAQCVPQEQFAGQLYDALYEFISAHREVDSTMLLGEKHRDERDRALNRWIAAEKKAVETLWHAHEGAAL